MTIQERIAAILEEHHQSDEYGYDIEECRCGDDQDGTKTWAAHVALVLTTELKLPDNRFCHQCGHLLEMHEEELFSPTDIPCTVCGCDREAL